MLEGDCHLPPPLSPPLKAYVILCPAIVQSLTGLINWAKLGNLGKWICLGLSGSGWVWLGVTGCDWVWQALAGSDWVWLGLTGSGWVWLGLTRSGWVWLGLTRSGLV